MSDRYETLETALEFSASHLPLNIFGKLITQVEEVITTNSDGTLLEHKIYKMVKEYANQNAKSAFDIKRLRKNHSVAA